MRLYQSVSYYISYCSFSYSYSTVYFTDYRRGNKGSYQWCQARRTSAGCLIGPAFLHQMNQAQAANKKMDDILFQHPIGRWNVIQIKTKLGKEVLPKGDEILSKDLVRNTAYV